ncbi:MAG: hypothetical protein EAX95_05785 [Candidatus Thorarchaeota archaeon]|nr:hypothetical protein [Candidatus Thorarchaeota archaeon]
MARTDILNYHEKDSYPSHPKAVAGVIIFLGAFFAAGIYSLWALWQTYGTDVMSLINSLLSILSLVVTPAEAAIGVGAIFGGFILLSALVALGASYLAKRLGGTLIYIGAVFMNVLTWAIPIYLLFSGIMTISQLAQAWPILIPGLFTLLLTVLLFTVFRDRVRRAGEIVKLTGQVCLDEKGVFVPPLLTMIFTLVSVLMFGAIIFQFTPLDVLLGNVELTLENGWPIGVGMVAYLFTTIFFYNFAYGTSSAMVYIYMRGRDPSLGDGVKSSIGVITGLIALSIASVLVVIVRIILERLGRQVGGAGGAAAGRMAGGVVGWVWALINYFTIPAMVAEELGAKDGIKRSAGLVRKNFVDVMIKETAVRWAFGVLAVTFFIAFALGGAALGWFLSPTHDIFMVLIFGILFAVLAGIPVTLVLRTFDIVYVTLLYVFIRRKEGEITGKTAITTAMSQELERAYSSAQKKGQE